jgi:HAD superfamily hydrolase (TIGR01459 family)
MAELVPGIEPLLDRYDGFLVDQFGVLYDGVQVLPGAREALVLLRERRKRVVILSNSGRRAAVNRERLARLGLEPELYAALVSSGEAAWWGLMQRTDEAFADLGRRCLYFSRGRDLSTLEGLDYQLAPDADSADFVLLSGLDPDRAARERCARALERAVQRGLPLICANPDMVSLEGERRVDGPGAFAARYAAAGGEVRYVGKPWPAVYRMALAILELPPERVCAVGDSLEHDIGGAAPFGIDGALVLDGVHADSFEGATAPADLAARLESLCRGNTYRPRWLLRAFRPAPAPEA